MPRTGRLANLIDEAKVAGGHASAHVAELVGLGDTLIAGIGCSGVNVTSVLVESNVRLAGTSVRPASTSFENPSTGGRVSTVHAVPSQWAATPSPVALSTPPTQTSESDRARTLYSPAVARPAGKLTVSQLVPSQRQQSASSLFQCGDSLFLRWRGHL